MAKRQVLVELKYASDVASAALESLEAGAEATFAASAVPSIAGLSVDTSFPPVQLPKLVTREDGDDEDDPGMYDMGLESNVTEEKEGTYLIRATVDEKDVDKIEKDKNVVGVFSDPEIQPCIVCPGSPPVGNDSDVERLLCVSSLRLGRMTGRGVLVAIVDSGVNMAYLNSRGKSPTFDAARSWVPRAGLTPGSLPVGHGTMCAYDACIAAPDCTLLDIALLQTNATGPTVMSGFLSDAVRAYRHLISVMQAPKRPGESRSLVVNNSWGMFHPSWDFPVGHAGNYSDNPNHPFNRIVRSLEAEGADILFAAGNCGANCPDGRCQGVTARAIYGANSSPSVLCVAGVDTTRARVGYSSIGPGRLTRSKPDISGYTHFAGSGVYAADGGTSAACPVVAGVVAALRSVKPLNPGDASSSPASIRSIITSTAIDLGAAGYDFHHGHGVVNGCELARRYGRPYIVIDICRRYPKICELIRWPRFINICEKNPWLCKKLRIEPEILRRIEPDILRRGDILDVLRRFERGGLSDMAWDDGGGGFDGLFDDGEDVSEVEAAFLLGIMLSGGEEPGKGSALTSGGGEKSGGCGCGCDD